MDLVDICRPGSHRRRPINEPSAGQLLPLCTVRVALAALLLSCTLVWADVSVDNEREHVGIDAGPSTPARRQARDFGRALDDYQGNRWSRAATPAPVG